VILAQVPAQPALPSEFSRLAETVSVSLKGVSVSGSGETGKVPTDRSRTGVGSG
jgi:hypothetical protein